MSSKSPEELRAKFVGLGEAEVRRMVKRGELKDWKADVAEAWLAEADRARAERERLFGHILLDPQQEELLIQMVDASRALSQRAQFRTIEGYTSGYPGLVHKGLPDGVQVVYLGDLETLSAAGLLSMSGTQSGNMIIDLPPLAYRYYEELKSRMGQPAQRLEATVRQTLLGARFRENYRETYEKWAAAERLVWQADAENQQSTIGHLCREAVVLFVTAQVNKYRPPNAPTDTQKYLNRMGAVIKHVDSQLGATERSVLDALGEYWEASGKFWEAMNNLIQRQEHGAQREQADALGWRDGRRVVFMTALMLYELDAALSRIPPSS